MDERQYRGDGPVLFCKDIMGRVPERSLDYVPPASLMEEGSLGVAEYEVVPSVKTLTAELANYRWHLVGQATATVSPRAGRVVLLRKPNASSMRTQRNSRNS